MKLPPGAWVLALCLASLAGWEPLRAVEQAPAVVLALTDPLVSAALPRDPRLADLAGRAQRVARARAAWERWIAEVASRPAVREPGHELLVVPVLSHDPARRELLLRVPEIGLSIDSPVTHRGALVGFVRPWVSGTRVAVRGGEARVALLGHPLARPVAAAWQAGRAAAVHFLLESGLGGPHVAHTSRKVDPEHGQLAWTRDVEALGDRVPPGLWLGRFEGGQADTPGGGLDRRPIELVPLLADESLGHVTLEVEVGHELVARQLEARLLAAAGGHGRRAIDKGRLQGVVPGDLVVQDGVLIGIVESVGPLSAQVRAGVAAGPLLVADPSGELTPVSARAESWPAGWTPELGAAVYSGHRLQGGLFAGTIAALDDAGLRLAPLAVDPELPVTVLEP